MPRNLLPEKKPLDMKAYIVNTDISTDPGEHWVAIYFRRDQVIYFDSYGRPPEDHYVLPFIERNSTRWIHNTVHGATYVECVVSTSFTSSTK